MHQLGHQVRQAVMTGRRHSRRRGQGLVEFALVLPVFLLILFGLVDVGRLVYMNTVLSQAAREATRVGSVEASWIGSTDASCGTTGGPTCPADYNAWHADVASAANRMVTPFGPIPINKVFTKCTAVAAPSGAWTDQTCGSPSNGNLISVRTELTFRPITPVIASIVGNVTLAGAATMSIN